MPNTLDAIRRGNPRVALSLALVAMLAACGSGGGGSSVGPLTAGPTPTPDACASTTFDSTYAAIQQQVFERHSCTTDACHGANRAGNLDLRAGVSHANLFDVPSAERPRAVSSWLGLIS